MGTSDRRLRREQVDYDEAAHTNGDLVGAPSGCGTVTIDRMDGGISGYTLMVAGRRTGKTSFLRLLLDTSTISPTASREQLASVAKFVQGCGGHTTHIRTASVNVQLAGKDGDEFRPLMLTLIDTPSLDFDDESTSHRTVSDILRHVDARFSESMEDEQKAQTGDHHVHLCLYFLDPDDVIPPSVPPPPVPPVPRARADSFTKLEPEPVILEPPVTTNPLLCRPVLPQADIATIRTLSARVNVLPVVARADMLTNDRLNAVKSAIRTNLAAAGIGFGIFDVATPYDYSAVDHVVPNSNVDMKNGYKEHRNNNPSNATSSPTTPVSPPHLRLPFALISPDIYSHSDGVSRPTPPRHELVHWYTPSSHPNSPQNYTISKIGPHKFIRSYRWGSLNVLDGNHCDFVHLRGAIFHHMETLQKYTREYLFERFRAEYEIPHPLPPQPQHLPAVSSRLPPFTHSARPILAIDTAPSISNQHVSLSVSRHPDVGPTPVGAGQLSMMPDLSPRTASSSRSARQRTKKITVACNFCRSRKLKCDGGRPACSQCFKRSNPCDYMVNNKRRGNGRRRKQEDGSDSEDIESGDPSAEMEPLQSPEVPSKASSRRNSRAEMLLAEPLTLPPLANPIDRHDERRPVLPPIAHQPPLTTPLTAPPVMTSSSGYSNAELPPIATLPVPLSASATDLAQSLPPLRGGGEAQTAQRRRTSSASAKGSRTSAYGSKIVACNFCRARKTRCDGGHPACGSCARRSLACNYVNDPTTTNPKGRPKNLGVGPSAPPSRRSSPSASTAIPHSGAVNGYGRHPDLSIEGVREPDLKRSLDLEVNLPSKKMRISDGFVSSAAVAVTQVP